MSGISGESSTAALHHAVNGDSPSARRARQHPPNGRIGHATGIRLGSSAEPELLEVRAGLLGRRVLLIPVDQIEEIVPEQKRILLSGAPQLVEQD